MGPPAPLLTNFWYERDCGHPSPPCHRRDGTHHQMGENRVGAVQLSCNCFLQVQNNTMYDIWLKSLSKNNPLPHSHSLTLLPLQSTFGFFFESMWKKIISAFLKILFARQFWLILTNAKKVRSANKCINLLNVIIEPPLKCNNWTTPEV